MEITHHYYNVPTWAKWFTCCLYVYILRCSLQKPNVGICVDWVQPAHRRSLIWLSTVNQLVIKCCKKSYVKQYPFASITWIHRQSIHKIITLTLSAPKGNIETVANNTDSGLSVRNVSLNKHCLHFSYQNIPLRLLNGKWKPPILNME